MNLKTFLSQVDNFCNDADKSTLHLVIRELCKEISEDGREAFLQNLLSYVSRLQEEIASESRGNSSNEAAGAISDNCSDDNCYYKVQLSDKVQCSDEGLCSDKEQPRFIDKYIEEADRKERLNLSDEVNSLIEFFKDLNPENAYLDSELNENYDYYSSNYYYDEDYTDCEFEFNFTDSSEILTRVRRACSLVHKCTEYELFEDGWHLADVLMNLEIKVKGDIYHQNGEDSFSLWSLPEYGLLSSASLKTAVNDILSLIYFNFDAEKRINLTLSLLHKDEHNADVDFNSPKDSRVTDLTEYDDFLTQLIEDILKDNDLTNYKVDSYIKKIAESFSSKELLCLLAKKYLKTYPYLMKIYVLSLLKSKSNSPELLSFIISSAQEIPAEYEEKGELLEYGILSARALNQQKALEDLCLELFSLKPCPANYLKLRYYADDYHKEDWTIRNIYEKAYFETGKDNYINDNHYFSGLFINSKFTSDGYHLMRMFDGRAYEFFCSVTPSYSVQNFNRTLFAKGLMLGVLLLSRNDASNKAFDWIFPLVSNLFSLTPEHNILIVLKFELSHLYKEVPNDSILRLWLENTSIENNDENKLFSIIDSHVTTWIFEALASKRSSLYTDILNWIVCLQALCNNLGRTDKFYDLINSIKLKHSGKKVFLRKLKEIGVKDVL